MAEQQHTPGPWAVVRGDGCYHVVSDEKRPSGSAFMTGCITMDGRGFANARLIAAAPDLLTACQAAAAELAEWDTKIRDMFPVIAGSEPRTAAVLKQVRAAIAKAAGEGRQS